MLISSRTSAARYGDHRWAIAQEKINRNILDSYPALKALDDSTAKVLLTGMDMPFQPFHTASYIRSEFGPRRNWTVMIPRGSTLKSEPPVQFLPPEAIQVGAYDAAFGFGADGRVLHKWTRAQLQQASTREGSDRILFPELDSALDTLAIDPGNWEASLRAGIVYFQWGELDAATGFLQRAAELNHYQNPYPVFFLGKVRESQGLLADARRYYAQAVTLDAARTNPAFRDALERLRQK
jgi:tetratricopeptide (TPR) repeat protein